MEHQSDPGRAGPTATSASRGWSSTLLDRSDAILRLAVATAALLTGASLSYHYLVYVPEKDRTAQATAEAEREEQKAAEDQSKQEERQESERRQSAYRACLADADTNYRSTWNASCRRLSSSAAEARRACIQRGETEAYCSSVHDPVSAENCSLPNALADDYNAALDRERAQCLDAARVGI